MVRGSSQSQASSSSTSRPGVIAPTRLCGSNGWYALSQAHCRLSHVGI
ncbi:hypothetical protein SLEP1_g16087 [Rubroshorea leprosula]|uniref:Uncharacterized protein n=1 Tax=Rubroshorea leprosula TaxID=152421 RepID=A0AAV5IYW9_9ROSI|nr:hypothetical protein SLEP1_g16087 [Rubroshorea leprosula]